MKPCILLLCVSLVFTACSKPALGTRLGTWSNARCTIQLDVAAAEDRDWPDKLTVIFEGRPTVFFGRYKPDLHCFVGSPVPGRPDGIRGAADIFGFDAGSFSPSGTIVNNYLFADGLKPGDVFVWKTN